MSEIYLSPRKLLSYLKDLESKVPVVNQGAYLSNDFSNSFLSDADLNREANKMLHFVGLTQCVPTCKFDSIEDGYAGYTINNHSIKEISIVVNNKYKGKYTACRAILAHEICHKVIFLNGIDFKYPVPKEFVEIYTDLCTIYIGFGKLILDGYIDSKSDTLKMGYLKVDMYRQTFNIIAKATGKYQIDGNIHTNDPYLDEALSIWSSVDSAKSSLREGFLNAEKRIAEMNRNILMLHQILDQVYSIHGELFRKSSNDAENLGIFANELGKKPITLFSMIYETVLEKQKEVNEAFTVAETEIYNLIMALTDEYKEIDLGALSYETLKCPNCGFESKTTIEDRDTIIRCPSCKIYFRFCNSHLNITKMRKLRSENLEQEKRRLDKIKSEIANIENEKKLIAQDKSSLKNELVKSFERGLSMGRSEKSAKYKKLLEKLPGWVKFLIGKRLPEDI